MTGRHGRGLCAPRPSRDNNIITRGNAFLHPPPGGRTHPRARSVGFLINSTKERADRRLLLLILLLRAGVEQNPGPYICPICSTPYNRRQPAVQCTRCLSWLHLRCTSLRNIKERQASGAWVGPCCPPPSGPGRDGAPCTKAAGQPDGGAATGGTPSWRRHQQQHQHLPNQHQRHQGQSS